jgi:hypothetical protein
MGLKLDEKLPYGTVYGAPGRVKFEQNGVLFDSNGDEVPDGILNNEPHEQISPTRYDNLPLADLQNMLLNRSPKYPTKKSLPGSRESLVMALRSLDD